jgi:hypothetical protein
MSNVFIRSLFYYQCFVKVKGRLFHDFAALYEKLFLRKFVLGFANDSWSKLLLKLYVSCEQRLNNLVRYGGEFQVNALKVAMFSRVCKYVFIGNQLSF